MAEKKKKKSHAEKAASAVRTKQKKAAKPVEKKEKPAAQKTEIPVRLISSVVCIGLFVLFAFVRGNLSYPLCCRGRQQHRISQPCER